MSRMFSIQRSNDSLPDGEYNAIVKSVRIKGNRIVVDFLVDDQVVISKFYDIDFALYSALWYFFYAVNEDYEGEFDFEEFREMVVEKELNIEIENVTVNDIDYCNVVKTYQFVLLQ